MGLFRFSNTGNADPSFQDSRLSYLKPDSHYANCVAPMPDGRIVTVSRNTKGGQIVRLLPDGSLDPTFGTNAIARYTITSLAIVSDGRIVVSGQFNLFAGARRPHLAWLTPNGELLPDRPLLLDPATFQSDGSLRLSIQSRVAGTAIFESSPDLQTWQPVTNFPVPIGKREILVHPPFGDSLFYRARLTRSP